MKRLGTLLALASLLVAGALFGCDLEEAPSPPTVLNTCTEQAQCGTGFCRADGHCEATGIEPIEVAFQVSYLTSFDTQPLVFQVPAASFSESVALPLEVPRPTMISGTIRMGQYGVPAQVTVVGEALVPGLPPVSALVQSVEEATTSRYEIAFPRGQRVRVRVVPTGLPRGGLSSDFGMFQADAVLPPLEADIVLEGDAMRLDFVYPSDIATEPCSATRRWDCRLDLTFEQTADSPETERLEALSVTAVVDNDTLISSYGRIHDGHVTLRIGRPTVTPGTPEPELSIVVGPSSERPDFPSIPAADVPAARPDFPTVTLGPIDVASPGVLTVPTMAPLAYVASVENLNNEPMSGAVILFTAIELDGYEPGTKHERVVIAASASEGSIPGRFEVRLFPGIYEALVTPARLEDGGLLNERITITAPLTGGTTVNGQIFKVPLVTELSGTVFSIDGTAAPHISVGVVPYSTSSARASSDLTNMYGGFALPVDPGDFDIVVRPFSGSYLPTLVIPLTASLVSNENYFFFPSPIFVSGSVSIEGEPVVSGYVSAYRVIRGETVSRSVLIGSESLESAVFEMHFAP